MLARVVLPFLSTAFLSLAACAQTQTTPSTAYTPSVGQPGKDVVWVPTPQALVDRMLDMAKLTKSDYLMDLGSGDGRTVITAAKRGATAHGVEYNPEMVKLSREAAQKEGVAGKASFQQADLFSVDLSKASVITMFLLPEINLRLRPKILVLKPGTRVVSNSFTMGDWKPDETASVDTSASCESWCTAYLWIVPAQVAGRHKLPNGDLTLKQEYQTLSGTLTADGRTVPIEGKVRGDQVSFKAGGKGYSARFAAGKLQLN
ncbi:MAG: SAM-dependent methyltransferase [Betaproteobacteria bacterium]